MCAALASAAAAHAAPASIGAASLAPAYAVERFAAERGGQLLWLRDGVDAPAVQRLLDTLQQAPLDGFAKGPELARSAQALLARARAGHPTALERADKLLSSAWVLYAQALHWPSAGMIYADPELAPRIPSPAQVLEAAAAAPSLEQHVAEVAAINPIYAELRSAALATADPSLKARIVANMNRARALPADGRFVLVDVATQQLWMMDKGRAVDGMRVVVGKTEMPTPLLAGTIRQATLNPFWNVPVDLARTSIAAKVLKSGTAYLSANGYELLSDWSAEAEPLSPTSVDWRAVAAGEQELRVRQRPGAGNMMGAMKFEFPNRHGIYLHDTPEKALFRLASRTASSGCIRLEDAPRLGRWLLGREPVPSGSAPEQRVALPTPVPVFITYLTVRPEGGKLRLADDVYGLDKAAEVKLAKR